MRVTVKGQVTIPKSIRQDLGIEPGSEVEFVARGAAVVLEKRVKAPAPHETCAEWAESAAGNFDSQGMDGKAYVDWLRGPRDDVDPG